MYAYAIDLARVRHSQQTRAGMAAVLPGELLHTILDIACFDQRSVPLYDALRHCALVCRAWAPHAQQLLFRYVSLRPPRALLPAPAAAEALRKARAFIAALDARASDRARALADAVRILKITVTSAEGNVRPDDLAAIITLCPRIYELQLAMVKVHIISPACCDRLATAVRLAVLRYKNIDSTASVVLYQLLRLWPSLRFLQLDGHRLSLPRGSPTLPPACRLQELRYVSNANEQVLLWALAASADSLEALEIDPGLRPLSLKLLAQVHGQRLRRLRLDTCDRDAADAFRLCPCLEECAFGRIPPTEVIDALPPSLQHLSMQPFQSSLHQNLDAVLNFISQRDALRLVTLINCGDKSSDECVRIDAACRSRGVELRYRNSEMKNQVIPFTRFQFPVEPDPP
ncbi:hypothetical protein BOTBODRAFT_176724 [Botryobasidium botryosum FD-172 SS1]|uniref:F-box domain-containing protein n=1 Tax=Botryobasidium botryosum (strain FD-172 SS1) TaxID=930990 RepID=A0A067M9E5_BOTB1|nr:hypothetical protein BOTBODRAFT_176724 [Botryobasidium botryosum FD-172 SS1]